MKPHPYRQDAIVAYAAQKHTLPAIVLSLERDDSFEGREVAHNLEVLQNLCEAVAGRAVAQYRDSGGKLPVESSTTNGHR